LENFDEKFLKKAKFLNQTLKDMQNSILEEKIVRPNIINSWVIQKFLA
jgi:hypothetical protein